MARTDGMITIGVKAETKQLDKDLKEIESKLKQYDKKREALNEKKSANEKIVKEYEEEKKRIDDLNDAISKLATREKELEEQHHNLGKEPFSSGQSERFRQINAEIAEIESKRKELFSQVIASDSSNDKATENYKKAKQELENIETSLQRITMTQNGLTQKSEEYKQKLYGLKKIQEEQKNSANSSIMNIGKGMDKIIGKVKTWALAIFGLRSMYSMIRSAVSIISGYDDQLSTDIEYIRYALAMTLKPIIEWIVKMVYQLLHYLQLFIYKITGINIFANATASGFKKATKNASDLKKQLAGFDEMNVLNDDKNAGKGTPSVDLSKLGDVKELDDLWDKITKFLQKVRKLANDIWDGIKSDLSKKFREWGFSEGFIASFQFTMDAIKRIFNGIVDLWKNVFKLIVAIANQDFDGIKEAFKGIIEAIKNIIVGFVSYWAGHLAMIGNTIKDAFTVLFNWIKDKLKTNPVVSAFSSMINVAKDSFNKLKGFAQSAWDGIKSVFSKVGNFFKDTFSSAWEKVKNVFSTGGKIFDGIKEGIETSFKTIVNKLIDGINKIVNKPFEKINEMLNKIHDVSILGIKPFSNLWNKNPISIPKIPKLRTGAILNMPGKGIYHNGAIMGEAGAEGILPLTDKSAMELLGRLIGENVVVNATMVNQMNGRIISRELLKVMNQSNFASNM